MLVELLGLAGTDEVMMLTRRRRGAAVGGDGGGEVTSRSEKVPPHLDLQRPLRKKRKM